MVSFDPFYFSLIDHSFLINIGHLCFSLYFWLGSFHDFSWGNFDSPPPPQGGSWQCLVVTVGDKDACWLLVSGGHGCCSMVMHRTQHPQQRINFLSVKVKKSWQLKNVFMHLYYVIVQRICFCIDLLILPFPFSFVNFCLNHPDSLLSVFLRFH